MHDPLQEALVGFFKLGTLNGEPENLIFIFCIQIEFSTVVDNKYGKAPVLEQDLCLGCGVCVHKCPTDSLTLVRKEKIEDPPENIREYGMRFIADRKAGIPLKRKSC